MVICSVLDAPRGPIRIGNIITDGGSVPVHPGDPQRAYRDGALFCAHSRPFLLPNPRLATPVTSGISGVWRCPDMRCEATVPKIVFLVIRTLLGHMRVALSSMA